MKVCHSAFSSSPLYTVTLSCLIITDHLLCISVYKARQVFGFFYSTFQTQRQFKMHLMRRGSRSHGAHFSTGLVAKRQEDTL